MHLTFAHHGLQFFFLTICVKGRHSVLSRLVEGEKRPELTCAGECVKALWRAVHGLNSALTASDYVIMPDHVHLLLIVNMVAVSLTRQKTLAEHEAEIVSLVEKAKQGWVVVCGFLSPGEKELERRLRAASNTRWIKTMAQGLPPRFDPTVEDSRYLATHRQLMLSALPVSAPFDWATCHRMNDIAAEMCRRARGECGEIS